MLENIRKSLFWSLDFLKGGCINAHYKDIESILGNPESAESRSKRTKSLEKLLKHAVSTTQFYKEFSDFKGLEDFTVIDKNIIRDYYDNFRSSIYKDKKCYSAYTSGSTGTPFKMLHNRIKKERNSADVIYFAQQAGFEIGHKLYYIRHWDQYNRCKPWIAWLKNIHMHPVSQLSRSDLKNLFRTLSKDSSTKGIICYASVLDEIKNYLESVGAAPAIKNLKSVIAISEHLKQDIKCSLEQCFKVPIVSRYSNVENGILAQQYVGSNRFQINWASYFVEILDMNANVPAKPGALGRIVITDLYNYCMPMIRYDTGDVGQLSYIEKNGQKCRVLERVEGRKMDMVFNTNGEMISPYVVYHILKYPHIKQYQFIQENREKYTIKLYVLPEFHSAENILNEFKEHLGYNAEITLDYVEDIPLLSSGKRKFVINRMNRSRNKGQAQLQV